MSRENSTVGYTPHREAVEGAMGKYVPATAGSATFQAVVYFKDSDGGEHTATLAFTLPFTCEVSTSWAELIKNDKEFRTTLTEVSSNLETTTKQVSTIEQHVDEIKLSVEQSTEHNNLIPNSWLNMVSNDYGTTCVRQVELTKGTTYILQVEGRVIEEGSLLRTFIHNADWSDQASVDITDTSIVTKTLTFTPTIKGTSTADTYTIDFYNKKSSETYYHVRRVKLEVAHNIGTEAEPSYVATGWCESEQDTDNSDLIKKILFGDTESVTAADGTKKTAYVVNFDNEAQADPEDGGIAVYPASTSELTALEAGETYTLSFFAKANQALTFASYLYTADGSDTQTMCQGSISSDKTIAPSEIGDGYWQTSLGTEWQRVSITFTTRTTLPTAYKLLVCRLETYGQKVWITDVKLEKGGRYTANAVTPDALEATGIDIKNRKIVATADNFTIRNNAGQTTASVDKDGNLTVPALHTLNMENAAGYAAGNIIIRNNIIEIFGTTFKVMELGVDGDNGFIHCFNSSGRMIWGIDSGEQIDYKTGVVIHLTNLQWLPSCFANDSSRLSTLVNTAISGSVATLTDEEQAAMLAMTAEEAAEVLSRYYAPHESVDSNTTLADGNYNLNPEQTAEFDDRVFVNVKGTLSANQLIDTYFGLTTDSDLYNRLRFDITPMVSNDTTAKTYKWTIYLLGVDGTDVLAGTANKVAPIAEFYYTAAIS